MADIDPETVKRCIEVLGNSVSRDAAIEELKVLAGIVPEKTEAEKLVDEWCQSRGMTLFGDIIKDYASLADFVLDKTAKPVLEKTINPVPQYVFGPWIEWKGGERPVPGDWMVETVLRDETLWTHPDDAAKAKFLRWSHKGWEGNITHYRVRFEVGKWYDWSGGACPVESGTKGAVRFRNGIESDDGEVNLPLSSWGWDHQQHDYDIIAFKVLPQ